MQLNQRRLLILSSLGGILEFYDFIIYALFADPIANAFFPTSNTLVSLMVTFATFAIGYLVRPLGGAIFGHFGDRIGRKATFTFSICLMAFATLAIGLVPPYSVIGMAAPILIVLLRIAQGFSIGGEIPGAIAYISESLSEKKGLACGIIFSALILGIVFGSITQAFFVSIFNSEQMQSYGWRLAFILGGLFGFFSYFLRREMHESAQFLLIKKEVENYPLLTVFKQQFKTVIAGIGIIACCAAIISSLFLFVPAYFSKVLHLPATAWIWQRTAFIALATVLCIYFGRLADKSNIKKLLLLLNILVFVLAYPIFFIYAYCPAWYPVAFLISAILTGFTAGTMPMVLSGLFPTKIRYSGIAVSYNFGFAIFGGLTPFISLSLVYYTGYVTAPAIYIAGVAFLGIATASYLSEPDGKSTDLIS